MIYNSNTHFKHLFSSCKAEFSFTPGTGWSDWQAEFRPRLLEILGITRMESDLEGFVPDAELVESVDMGSYARESWRLTVEPTVPLPFYLLRPKTAETEGGRTPLVLTPHGHNHPYIYVGISTNEDEKAKIIEGERDIAVQAVNEGYLVIAPTSRGFGETRTAEEIDQNAKHSCRTQLMHDLLVGRTPIGERVWDISRLIDWAIHSQNVDADRIAVTGNSGGGTVSLFSGACDTRIAVSVPSCYFNTFEGSIGAMRHCDCNYVPGILRLGEMYDVAGLTAPRAFLSVAGKDDGIFPVDRVRFAFDKLQDIYAAAGAEENCRLFVGNGGHRYYKKPVWPFIREQFAKKGG